MQGSCIASYWRCLCDVHVLFSSAVLIGLICCVTTSSYAQTTISGTVYEDFDYDGIRDSDDPGIANITLTLSDINGSVEVRTTDGNGNFSFTGLISGTEYQLRLGALPAGWSLTKRLPSGPTDVMIIIPSSNDLEIGITDAANHCETNPMVIVPCYVEGVLPGALSNEAALVGVLADADGHDYNGTVPNADYEASALNTYGEVGTIYGLAYQASSRTIYGSAFHKRYSDFGPGGSDVIYQFDARGQVIGQINLDNLLGISGSTGGDVHDFTTVNGEVFDLGSNDVSLDAVGKRAWGDIEIARGDSILYAMNLWDRKVYGLDVTAGVASQATVSETWTVPDPTGAGAHRPFALAWHDDQLWIGIVSQDDLEGWIYSLNPVSGSFTQMLTIDLSYERQAFFGRMDNPNASADWNTWLSNTTTNYIAPSREIAYPQAMITDIDFAADGAMIIALRDRFGDQAGDDKLYRPSDTQTTWAIAQGDLLKACFINGSFVLETGTSGACPTTETEDNSGIGGGEFYYWDIYSLENNNWDPTSLTGAFHWEVIQGGLLQLDNRDHVIVTAMDPFDDFSGGLIKMNNSTGRRTGLTSDNVPTANLTGGYTIYDGGDFVNGLPDGSAYLGKANGLGDVEAVCVQDIEVGNLIWADLNNNGRQDVGEPGLSDVLVELYQGGTLIGTTQTTDGYYYFGGPDSSNLMGVKLEEFTSYEIRVSISDAQANDGSVSGLTNLTTQDDSADDVDSDAYEQNGSYIVSFTTDGFGQNDYSFDMGLGTCQNVSTTITQTYCSSDNFSIQAGATIFDEMNPFGQVILMTSDGCDSTVNVDLSFLPSASSTYTYMGLSGDGFQVIVNGTTYDESTPTGVENLFNQSGCDSTVTITLTFENVPGGGTDCTTEYDESFESGYNGWGDGGSDCTRINDPSVANTGNFSVRLRDNSSTSTLTSPQVDADMADSLRISFHYHPFSFENGEDFWLQISTDNGNSYTTVRTWLVGQDFTNGVADDEVVNVPGPFTSQTRVRFRCDASGNGDFVYIDDISIETCIVEEVICPSIELSDTLLCAGSQHPLSAVVSPVSPSLSYTWSILNSSTSTGGQLVNSLSATPTLDLNNATLGLINVQVTVSDGSSCMLSDSMAIVVGAAPACDFLGGLVDTICNGDSRTIGVSTRYRVSPETGFVPPAPGGVGVTQDHTIFDIQDPEGTMLVITLPTWDDHFDEVLLNGRRILPEVFETASYDPVGMDCVTPWIPNQNGLPRSVVTIQSDEVRYYSTRTTTSTQLIEVFPTAWVTTPQPFIEGDNVLQFGIQNTNGPVGGSWSIEAISNVGYSYLWSTGDTTANLSIAPTASTTYQVTVTTPSGCESTCTKEIFVAPVHDTTIMVSSCSESGYSIMVNQVLYNEQNPQGQEIMMNQYGCDSLISIDLQFAPFSSDTITYSGCSDDGFTTTVNGTLYDVNNPSGVEMMTTTSGCDSIITVMLQFEPQAEVDAGMPSEPLCSNSAVDLAQLGASITGGTNQGTWTSTEGGQFLGGSRFGSATGYQPSENEISNGVIILTLTSDDPPGLCEPEADAVMILINDLRCSRFPWAGN